MTRTTSFLLFLAAVLLMLAVPVAAQDETAPPADVTTAPASSMAPAVTAGPSPMALPGTLPVGDGPLVQAVLFFSPTCGHCHYVITETLPPLFAKHGGEPSVIVDEEIPAGEVAFYLMSNGRLQVLLVDVSVPDGQAVFLADTARLDIDSAGVPRLDVAESYLVGSGDIPDIFPGMVEDGLAGDGIGWPSIPGLEAALAPFVADGSVPDHGAAAPEPSAAAGAEASAATGDDEGSVASVPLGGGNDDGPLDRVARDPLGNGVSIVVLILLAVSVVAAPVLAARRSLPAFPGWFVPVLAAVGMAVAAYLASVETSGADAVCGPVGDCNAVQQSEYASILGVPVGVLGVLGYVALGVLWFVPRVARGELADWALMLVGFGVLGGMLFSIYLTFVEPFVIGATCIWCITSALVMMALLWITAGPAWAAWQRIGGKAGNGTKAATT